MTISSTSHLISTLVDRLPEIKFRLPAEFNGKDPGFHPQNLQGGLMALPCSTAQVQELLSLCNDLSISVVAHGGRTGLSGAAASDETQLILDTSSLDKIIHIDAVGGTAHVQSGVPLERLEQSVNALGLSCGIDLAARGSATIGGMVSTNAGGIEAFRNGVMRHRVLGLEAVIANGEIVSDLKYVTKANEGYDVKQLFIGAEGTLGVVTEVVVDLVPKEPNAITALVSCTNAGQAVLLFRGLHNHPKLSLLSAEVMWSGYARTVADSIKHQSVIDFDNDPEALFVLIEVADAQVHVMEELENFLMQYLENGDVQNAVIAKNAKEAAAMWRIREGSFVVDDVFPHGIWFDMSVPLNHMEKYADNLFKDIAAISTTLKVFLFAHLGDGNFHATISAGRPIDEWEKAIKHAVYKNLNELSGSFSAEHGIGIEKRESLSQYTDQTKLALMHAIKNVFDPNDIMNPDKVLTSK